MSNCLMEATIQQAFKNCGCYPSYMFPSNDSCFGDSLICFKSSMSLLGIVNENHLINAISVCYNPTNHRKT